MQNVITSPIFYMGNKKRLINKGLLTLFPEGIDTFYDMFAGSCVVSMNTDAKIHIINDIDKTLHTFYEIFRNHSPDEIISHIEKRVEQYSLPKEITIRCKYPDKNKIELYKKAYISFRNEYNKNKVPLDLYTLMFFSFSQQFRVNSKDDFNMPFGNNCFADINKQYIKDGCNFFHNENLVIRQESFSDIGIEKKAKENDFVYLDPPYIGTTATYNENGKWTNNDNEKLFLICAELDKRGVKWGLSNVLINKSVLNEQLYNFCKNHNYNVYTPNDFRYHACGKENLKTCEVYICNYMPNVKESEFKKIDIENFEQ